MNSKEQSKIINSIGSPKLREFRNENAAMCRPSSLQFRHSYIIKHLVRRLSQPMIARPIKTARSLQIFHEIGQILSHQYRERTSASVILSCKNVLIGLTSTCDVSREKYRTSDRAHKGLRCKENESIPIEHQKKQTA